VSIASLAAALAKPVRRHEGFLSNLRTPTGFFVLPFALEEKARCSIFDRGVRI
jgi:hypothetical protein